MVTTYIKNLIKLHNFLPCIILSEFSCNLIKDFLVNKTEQNLLIRDYINYLIYFISEKYDLFIY